MKSIMEEASSIMKAIEKGWIQAGKPQEFTIKVYEDATKNFLGISTKPAKIGIFFNEAPHAQHRPTKQRMPKEEPIRQPHHQPKRPVAQPQPQRQRVEQPQVHHHAQPQTQAHAQQPVEKKPRETWTPEMVDFVKGWTQETLTLMGNPAHFDVEVKNYYLKLQFSSPVMQDQSKERFLFKNFAYLIMQSLRNKFKKNLRGFKIILSSE